MYVLKSGISRWQSYRLYSSPSTVKSVLQSRIVKHVAELPSLETNSDSLKESNTASDNIKYQTKDGSQLLSLLLDRKGSGEMTPQNPMFSIILNRCLSISNSDNKLRTKTAIESFYEAFNKIKASNKVLNEMVIFDLNRICQYFIHCRQLSKGQDVLSYLINCKISHSNIFFLQNYLKLRCGSDLSLWRHGKYRTLDYTTAFTLSHNHNNSRYIGGSIIQAFGFMRNVPGLEQYLNVMWGITMEDTPITENHTITSQLKPTDLLYPTSGILISVMCSYYYIDNDIFKSFKALDLFLQKYPNIQLDYQFWYKLLDYCILLAPKGEKDDSTIVQIWNAIKLWHKEGPIPYNPVILGQVYRKLKDNNNLYHIQDIYLNCIGPYTLRHSTLSNVQLKTASLYQKHIIRKLIDKKKFNQAMDFISQWSISLQNKESLLQFYNYRTNIRRKKTSYDDSMDDMFFGIF